MSNPAINYNLIIDTDVGCDDATAIALCLQAPHARIHAITTCFGNVSAHQSAINVHILTTLTNCTDIPIYLGAATPLSGHTKCDVWPGHGIRGTGLHEFEHDLLQAKRHYSNNSNISDLESLILDARQLDATHSDLSSYGIDSSMSAAHALVHMVTEKKDFYDIIAIGPLTNIALAIQIEPCFLSYCHSLTWMGGTAYHGNVTPTSEFNAHADDLAADIVFYAAQQTKPITCVGWDPCLLAGLDWSEFDAITANASKFSWNVVPSDAIVNKDDTHHHSKDVICPVPPSFLFPYIMKCFNGKYDELCRSSVPSTWFTLDHQNIPDFSSLGFIPLPYKLALESSTNKDDKDDESTAHEMHDRHTHHRTCILADVYAVMAVLYPDLIQQSVSGFYRVSCSELYPGTVIEPLSDNIDSIPPPSQISSSFSSIDPPRQRNPITLVTKINRELFIEYLMSYGNK